MSCSRELRLVRFPFAAVLLAATVSASPMDVAPFALPLPVGGGLMWEDPREIHRVEVHFRGPAPETNQVRLEYWGSRWPDQRLPKDREAGGGDVGWMELGNWYKHGWRVADTNVERTDDSLIFTFQPVDLHEFPQVKDYPARFRYTLKLRVTSDATLPVVERFEAYTDSRLGERVVRLVWDKAPGGEPSFEAFNGSVDGVDRESRRSQRLRLKVAVNPDPNTFDRTLVTVRTREFPHGTGWRASAIPTPRQWCRRFPIERSIFAKASRTGHGAPGTREGRRAPGVWAAGSPGVPHPGRVQPSSLRDDLEVGGNRDHAEGIGDRHRKHASDYASDCPREPGSAGCW